MRSKEGVVTRAIVDGDGVVFTVLDARFRKYNHPEVGRASAMTVPLLLPMPQGEASTMYS